MDDVMIVQSFLNGFTILFKGKINVFSFMYLVQFTFPIFCLYFIKLKYLYCTTGLSGRDQNDTFASPEKCQGASAPAYSPPHNYATIPK